MGGSGAHQKDYKAQIRQPHCIPQHNSPKWGKRPPRMTLARWQLQRQLPARPPAHPHRPTCSSLASLPMSGTVGSSPASCPMQPARLPACLPAAAPLAHLWHDGEGERAQAALQQVCQLSHQLGLAGQLARQELHKLGTGKHAVAQGGLALLRKACRAAEEEVVAAVGGAALGWVGKPGHGEETNSWLPVPLHACRATPSTGSAERERGRRAGRQAGPARSSPSSTSAASMRTAGSRSSCVTMMPSSSWCALWERMREPTQPMICSSKGWQQRSSARGSSSSGGGGGVINSDGSCNDITGCKLLQLQLLSGNSSSTSSRRRPPAPGPP